MVARRRSAQLLGVGQLRNRHGKIDHKSYKCTLCLDRVDVGLEPACVKACPTGAIMFGTKSDMTDWAGDRIKDLKSRGFESAGLYDPPSVSGTHVMYVLHHAALFRDRAQHCLHLQRASPLT
jgi:Fe-S-cluster-containing dehydrogenase component